jgi:hypothetical protein
LSTRDPLQLFRFDNQGTIGFGFGDHRPFTEYKEIEPGFLAHGRPVR